MACHSFAATMRQRRFLAGTTAALGAGMRGCEPLGAAVRRMFVVGAGMSGFAAVTDLKARGFEVIAIQGRDRLGCRIRTVDRRVYRGCRGDPAASLKTRTRS